MSNDKIPTTNAEPDAILEYFFVDKDFDQEDPVKYKKGTFYDSIDLFFTGKNKNADLATFRNLLPLKVRARADELIYFEDRAIDLRDYKYGVIDEDKKITEFDSIDENFFNALKKTLKLIIFGKDFDLERFKTHKVFEDFYKINGNEKMDYSNFIASTGIHYVSNYTGLDGLNPSDLPAMISKAQRSFYLRPIQILRLLKNSNTSMIFGCLRGFSALIKKELYLCYY